MNEEGKQPYHPKIRDAATLVTQWDHLSIKQETSSTACGRTFEVISHSASLSLFTSSLNLACSGRKAF